MRGIIVAGLSLAVLLASGLASGQTEDGLLRRLEGGSPLPRSLSCAPFLDYQQPLDEEGRHSSFLSDEVIAVEMAEATVDGETIIPVPGALIEGMRVWGLSVGNNTLANCFEDDGVPFDVHFYSNQGGVPGSLIDATVTVPIRVDTGLEFMFPGLTIQQFDFDFVPPIDNSREEISWLGVVRQLGEPDCLFHWIDETTEAFDDMAFWDGRLIGVDMSFCLALEPVAVELERFEVD